MITDAEVRRVGEAAIWVQKKIEIFTESPVSSMKCYVRGDIIWDLLSASTRICDIVYARRDTQSQACSELISSRRLSYELKFDRRDLFIRTPIINEELDSWRPSVQINIEGESAETQ